MIYAFLTCGVFMASSNTKDLVLLEKRNQKSNLLNYLKLYC